MPSTTRGTFMREKADFLSGSRRSELKLRVDAQDLRNVIAYGAIVRHDKHEPTPDTSSATPVEYDTSDMPTESQRKLIAFEIAEAAKKQVTAWARWIVGVSVVVAATLGIKTYLDIQRSIRDAAAKQIERAQEQSRNAIARFEEEQKNELAAFREKSKDELAKLELSTQEVLATVQRTGHEAQVAILEVVDRTTTATESTRSVDRRARQRPIGPGISISGKSPLAATICCVVKDHTDQRFVLTVRYILGTDANDGEVILQPGTADGGTDQDAIGVAYKSTQLATIIRLNEGVSTYCDIPDVGRIKGISEPRLGEQVRKYGRTTGLTLGTVGAIGVTIQIAFPDGTRPVRCSLVRGASGPFSRPGDSGAPVVNARGELLGMSFAGNSDGSQSFFVPIKPILEELGVELVLGR